MSVPQAGLDNRTSPLYTGVVVGGGTVVNGMFFNRGSAGDYDAWENLGNPGWGWEGLLPYFKKVSLRPSLTSWKQIMTFVLSERNVHAALR
jgi:choline dehydrogenase-like flavoprotein